MTEQDRDALLRHRENLTLAKEAFIRGEVLDPHGAAALYRLDVSVVRRAFRREDWPGQRKRHKDTEALKERARQQETLERARMIATVDAWQGLAFLLRDIKERALAGLHNPHSNSPEDAAARLAFEKLKERRANGDPDASPLHVTPAGARALGQLAEVLTASMGKGGGAPMEVEVMEEWQERLKTLDVVGPGPDVADAS